jgi:hypothetical protein
MTECCTDIQNEFVHDVTVFINEQLDSKSDEKDIDAIIDKISSGNDSIKEIFKTIKQIEIIKRKIQNTQ